MRGEIRADARATAGHGSRARRLRCVVLVGFVLALLVPSGAFGATLQVTLLSPAGYVTLPIGFARTADGRLHVAYETSTSWGDAANGVADQSISPAGKIASPVQALNLT